MKVLISAYSCEPGQGSERGVGWNVAREIAKYHEVWVLTRPDEGKEAIEAEMAAHPNSNLHFVYFTLPLWGGGWKWKFGAMQLHYYLWQVQAYLVARRLHHQIRFDVAHHVTFVKYSRPSFLCLLPIPLIWGPVGGAEFAPKTFWKDFSWRNRIHELARMAACHLFELDPFTRLTARRSWIASATTADTAVRIQLMGAKQVQVMAAIGLSREEIDNLQQKLLSPAQTVRFVSIGRLLHWKGFHLGLRAFAQARLPNAEYWVVGDGPEKRKLQLLADELKIAGQVKFLGDLSRAVTLQTLKDCTVLVHPSLHDSGGLVCLEAMAAGLPVLCLDLGGPALQVTPQTGFKIAAHTPEQAVQQLAQSMTHLACHPELCLQMAEASRQRVNQVFSWEVKGQTLAQLYEVALAQPDYPDVVDFLPFANPPSLELGSLEKQVELNFLREGSGAALSQKIKQVISTSSLSTLLYRPARRKK